MKLDYTIIVPSRRRAHNMLVLRELLPDAIICVDEAERMEYGAVVPNTHLLFHPPMGGSAAVRNWLLEHVKAPILIMIDDDFVGVQVTTGSRRFIRNSEEILAILENGARGCHDLELSTFCFSGTPNTTIIRPDERPFVPTQPVFRVFGIMNNARHRKWREDVPGRADLDWTLRTLLIDRCVYADVRFFFDCGPVFAGRGGSVALISPEQFNNASREIVQTWGTSISFKAPAFVKKREVASISLRVQRTNRTAQR